MTRSRLAFALCFLLSCARDGAREQRAHTDHVVNPFAEHVLEPSLRRWVHGHVAQRHSAGHYVYLQLRDPSGRMAWLVSLAATTPATDDIEALVVGEAEHFHSRRLDRDFSPLLFAAVRPATP